MRTPGGRTLPSIEATPNPGDCRLALRTQFETDRQCRVETGQWFGAFTSVYVEDPGDLDVDHIVPLRNTHLSGAWSWNPAMKEEYANYLEDPDHLITVSSRANRNKGARGPEEWKPLDETYWCEYAQDWAEIKASVGTHHDRREGSGRGGDASEVREPAGGGGLGSPGECDGGT